jgi:hypothetical protein
MEVRCKPYSPAAFYLHEDSCNRFIKPQRNMLRSLHWLCRFSTAYLRTKLAFIRL